jgi:hypothetical protein
MLISVYSLYHQRWRPLGPSRLEILWRRYVVFADHHGEPEYPDRTGIRSRTGDSDTDPAAESEYHHGFAAVEADLMNPVITCPIVGAL